VAGMYQDATNHHHHLHHLRSFLNRVNCKLTATNKERKEEPASQTRPVTNVQSTRFEEAMTMTMTMTMMRECIPKKKRNCVYNLSVKTHFAGLKSWKRTMQELTKESSQSSKTKKKNKSVDSNPY
jgi:hypothetical protein